MTSCTFCRTSELIESNKYIYCPTCESYFTLTNIEQKHVYVKIEETDQITLKGHLCGDCEKKYNIDKYITCLNFNEYYNKLTLCEKCRTRNLKFIKNSYYKNFLLYKAEERAFSNCFILLILMLWFIFSSSFGVFFLTVLFIYIRINHSVIKSIFWAILFTVITIFIPVVSNIYLLYLMITSKRNVFKIPQNLEKSSDIDLHIQSLSLSSKVHDE